MMHKYKTDSGMTLIEITVAMGVAFIVAAAIFATYRAQQMTHLTQRTLVEMNQNIRSAVLFMTRDLRMAAFDPTWASNATFTIANEGEMAFQIDVNRNGTIDPGDETIHYALTNDPDRDGIANGFPCHLGREEGNGGLQIIAENIEAIDFEYMTYSALPPSRPVSMNTGAAPDGVPIGGLANLQNDIRFVRVTIVARSADAMPVMSFRQTDTRAYTNASNTRPVLAAQNDTIRRSALTTEIQLRNM